MDLLTFEKIDEIMYDHRNESVTTFICDDVDAMSIENHLVSEYDLELAENNTTSDYDLHYVTIANGLVYVEPMHTPSGIVKAHDTDILIIVGELEMSSFIDEITFYKLEIFEALVDEDFEGDDEFEFLNEFTPSEQKVILQYADKIVQIECPHCVAKELAEAIKSYQEA